MDGWPELHPDRLDEVLVITLSLDAAVDATDMTFRLRFSDALTDEQIRQWLALGIREGWTHTLERLPIHLDIHQEV